MATALFIACWLHCLSGLFAAVNGGDELRIRRTTGYRLLGAGVAIFHALAAYWLWHAPIWGWMAR